MAAKPLREVGELAETGGSAGWAGWLLAKLRTRSSRTSQLHVLERVSLAPRQSLVLVETEGRRLLVATSADAAPAFFSLDAANPIRPGRAYQQSVRQSFTRSRRVSW